MKKLLLIGLVLSFALSTYAQEEKKMKYLFSSESGYSFSGFASPFVQFGSVEGNFATYVGGGAALLINQQVYIGGYGMGLATNHYRYNTQIDKEYYYRLRTNFGHGGFWLGYINKSYNVIHWGISTKLGWGQLSLTDNQYDYSDPVNYPHNNFGYYLKPDNVFVITPQIEAEANLTKWMKLNLAVGYQGVVGFEDMTYSGSDKLIYDPSDYNSITGSISLFFGFFGKKKK